MKNYVGMLICDVKEFLSSENNRLFVAVIIVGMAVCFGQIRTEKAINKVYSDTATAKKELLSEIKENRKDVHFRYFNLTTSLEEIFAVKIDTKDGKLEK